MNTYTPGSVWTRNEYHEEFKLHIRSQDMLYHEHEVKALIIIAALQSEEWRLPANHRELLVTDADTGDIGYVYAFYVDRIFTEVVQ